MSAEQRIAVVTGASRGLGLETVRKLAENGLRVILTARSMAAVEQALDELGRTENFEGRVCDVSDRDSVDALFIWLADAHGRIDVLVNNAGRSYGSYGEQFSNIDTAEILKAVDNNALSALRMIQKALPVMNQARYGRIVNVSSGAGALDDMNNGVAAYRVSKAAMNVVTRIVSNETGDNVKINSICPGWVRTDMGGPNAKLSLAEGAAGIIWAATLPDDGPNGGFFRHGIPIDW
jgi:NAD(P)-dependent dehydrogenase (short-subunit alcohol dehydrogenase family)